MTSVTTISSATLLEEDITAISIKVAATLDLSKPGCLFRQKVNKIRAGVSAALGRFPCWNINVCVASVSCCSLENEAMVALKYQCGDLQVTPVELLMKFVGGSTDSV